MFYFSTRQTGFPPSYVVARTDGDPATLIASMVGSWEASARRWS